MALPVTIPNTFANATAAIPLSQLDSNFTTLSNVINQINAGTQQLSNANVAVLIMNAGTSAAPSITFTGDTNTGIFSPAADTIAFAEGGVEAMRLDSSGNLGLGVTPSAWAGVVSRALQFQYGCSIAAQSNAYNLHFLRNAYFDSGWKYLNTAPAVRFALNDDGGTSGFAWFTAPSGTAGNAISFTQAMTLDASGNLGVGVTDPATYSGVFVAQATSGANFSVRTLAGLGGSGTGVGLDTLNNGASSVVDLGIRANTIQFRNAGSEAARIDSSGNLLVGITSARANAGDVQVSKGISFPATQSAQSDANTLDDYEEGTWSATFTASVSNPTVTYNNQTGAYVKIGRLVYFQVYITVNTTSGGSGNLSISGFPFTSAASTVAYGGASVTWKSTPWATTGPDYGHFGANGTTLVLIADNNTDQTILTASNLQNGCEVIVNGYYLV